MWPKTDLMDLLEIEHPIIQAPMAGSTTVALAAAVSSSGGLGSFGYSEATLDRIKDDIAELRMATDKPFNLNFFTHTPPVENKEVSAQTRARIKPFYEEKGLGEVPASACVPFGTFDKEKLSMLLELKPSVVSFHFGLPDLEMVRKLRSAGCTVLCSATTVAEAKMLAEAGVDAVIAQGWEAGGHRGTFDLT